MVKFLLRQQVVRLRSVNIDAFIKFLVNVFTNIHINGQIGEY